jgi:predicted MFS family arabinose efflux permease
VVLALALAALTLPLFIGWELSTPQPLLNLRLFALPAFSIGALINLVAMVTLFGATFLVPVFLQNLRGLGPMQTGLMLVPQALASTVSIVLGGRLYDLVGPRPLILIGLVITAVSTWPLVTLDVTTADSTLVGLLALRGVATGFLIMPAITAWMAAAPPSQTAAASALNNVLRQLYGTFGTAIFASLLQARATFHQAHLAAAMVPEAPAVAHLLARGQQAALESGLSLEQGRALVVGMLAGQVRQAATVRGFDDCFAVATLLCLLGLVPALLLGGGRSSRRPAPAPAPAPRGSADPA